MLMLIYFALLSTVSCNGVYRFSREPIESAPELRKINGKINYCPDDQTQCFDDQTCCQLSDGSYGCCPLPSAVCCSDHQHCCPKNTKCNLSAGTCDSVNNKVVTTLKLKVPPIKTKIICPGGEAQCGNDQTCCQLSDGSYGCCPFSSAVCCSDHQHCCPKGTKCNLSDETCDSANNKVVTPLKLKIPAMKTTNICPDGEAQCGSDQTCCQLSDGSYGCCPFSSAVCCSDHQHCCPKGTKCNLSDETCDSVNNKVVTPLKLKVPPIKTKIICPDGEAQCGSDQTCCQLSDGSYGCCPFSSAVCCSDHQHCCPKNTKCNLSAGTCDSANNKVVTTLKLKVPPIKTKLLCPDGKSQCGDQETCCPSQDGSFVCCPAIKAVCCSDHQHCCPENTVCNLINGTCDGMKITRIPLLKSKIQPVQSVKSVMCPVGKYKCEDDFTCCLSADDTYSCCPYSSATCCNDRIHCCPNGTVCNLKSRRCENKQNINISTKKYQLAVLKTKYDICPDGQSQCDDGYTCCLNAYGSFGCCLGVNSVCCSDKMHCCPENTICNIPNGTCDSVQNRQIFSIKPKTKESIVKHTSCPDGSPCEDGYTCCPMVDNTYGCCSYTDAVCCSDHSHCCPSGTTCSLNTKTCDKDFFQYIFNRPIRHP